MEPKVNDYHISFFKPTTDNAKRNRNIVVQFVLIWAVAIFGFQILLKILEKPTPEPAFNVYETYRSNIQSDNMSIEAMKNVGQSALSVLGKISIQPDLKLALENAVSWMAYNIADSIQKEELTKVLAEFEQIALTTDVITNEAYLAKKNELVPILQNIFQLHPNDVRSKIAVHEVKSALLYSFDAENREKVDKAMNKYLIHNQSFLTDMKFLGFPFHYFYTAVFLLVLFVGLCWLYCVRIDTFHKKYGIED